MKKSAASRLQQTFKKPFKTPFKSPSLHSPASSEKESYRYSHAGRAQLESEGFHNVDEIDLAKGPRTNNNAVEEPSGLEYPDEDAGAMSRIQYPDNDEEVEWVSGEILGLESSCGIYSTAVAAIAESLLASFTDRPSPDRSRRGSTLFSENTSGLFLIWVHYEARRLMCNRVPSVEKLSDRFVWHFIKSSKTRPSGRT